MENNNITPINEEINKTTEEKTNRKEYKKPSLKHYGGISELVLMNVTAGGDGGSVPLEFSM